MAAIAILSQEKGWAGDRMRNRVIFTSASATTDTVTPVMVGMQHIDACVPTGRSGTIVSQGGSTNPTSYPQGTSITVVAAGAISLAEGAGGTATQVIIAYIPTSTSAVSSGNYEVDFYGK
jgi:hypothetical protein